MAYPFNSIIWHCYRKSTGEFASSFFFKANRYVCTNWNQFVKSYVFGLWETALHFILRDVFFHALLLATMLQDTHLLLTGGMEKTLRVYDMNRPDAAPRELDKSPGSVRTVAWLHSDQTILSSCTDMGGVRCVHKRYASVNKNMYTGWPFWFTTALFLLINLYGSMQVMGCENWKNCPNSWNQGFCH